MKIEKVYRKDLKAYRWKIDVTVAGQRVRRADFETKREAVEAIAGLHTKARADRYNLTAPQPKVKLQDLYNSAEKDRALKNSPEALRIFKKFMGLINPNTLLITLTKADWKKYVDSLRERDCQPRTINRYLADVSRILSSAPERFPDLGEWRPPQAPWLPAPPGRDRLLSKDEIAKLLAALRSERRLRESLSDVSHRHEVYDLFRLMLLTGAREGEMLHLRQSQVSWDWRTVRIVSEKGGGSVRVVPLSESALAILRSRTDHAPRFFKKLSHFNFYKPLRRAAKDTGITYGNQVDGGWVIYDLRHVAGTVMESGGVPYSAVSAILGHKRRDQTATYAHAQLETLRRGVETIENWCREIDGFFCAFGQEEPFSDPLPRSVAK